ncbi:hypothetical protein MAR_029430 [Mya arenaria]|uniref:Uncharacterized protein n=1 Tax=Mya arenaria TaxID=6604 RepID=A0ABY7DP13_MYAAR|nr:uncharacterized protein LOC128203049 [Mya arenaria]XP_052760271.1 uncharacterized protein LOC128203049 [Mya arenaria]WAQ96740.1 hypothetical protein MAR_029430 [Mya arenaria]
MFVLLVCALLTVAAADECRCTPNQWEGDMGLVLGSTYAGNTSLTEGTMQISYDAVKKMIVTRQSLMYNNIPVQQTIIEDFTNGISYTVTAQGCSSKALGPWIPNCIPSNATTANLRYGLGDNSVDARSYMVDYGTFMVYFAVTADTCVPVAEDVTGTFDGAQIMEVITFANIKAGISDSNVFAIPANCPTQNSVPLPGVNRRASMFRGYV